MNILHALNYGYTASTVLNYLMNRYPNQAGKIRQARNAGYHAESILSAMDRSKGQEVGKYLTHHERAKRKRQEIKSQGARNLIGTVGAIAGGLGYLGHRNQSIQPTEILGPEPFTPPNQPRGLPAPKGPSPMGQPPGQQGPSPRPPQQGPQVPRGPQRNPERNLQLINQIDAGKNLSLALEQGYDIPTTAEALKFMMPKTMLDSLRKGEGGIQQVLQDYQSFLQTQPQQQPVQQQPIAQPQQMTPPVQQEAPPQTPMIQPEINMPVQQQTQPIQSNKPGIHERIQEAVYGGEKPQRTSIEMQKRDFAIPNYVQPGETKQEFNERKRLYDVVNKAAKLLEEGKSYLDFPTPEGVQYSVAADVLRFIAGIPNIYDPLLDDDEKEALSEIFTKTGHMTVPELAPTPGERNVYGAQMTPNLVWNLLLTLEPKLKDMAPKSVKGYQTAPGKKMGTSELRRFLTHSVYGALSGKTISSDLADKISKISQAASSVDAIANAAKSGNIRKLMEELEKGDIYVEGYEDILEMEIGDLLRMKKMSPEEKESFLTEKEILRKEDIKSASALKAAKTRKEKNKDGND